MLSAYEQAKADEKKIKEAEKSAKEAAKAAAAATATVAAVAEFADFTESFDKAAYDADKKAQADAIAKAKEDAKSEKAQAKAEKKAEKEAKAESKITESYDKHTEATITKSEERADMLSAYEQAKADEINAIWLKEHGFDADGNVWIVLGNTYIIRDQLRELGCQFNSIIGWHIDHELTEYPTIKLTSSQLCLKDIDGVFYALSLGNATELIGEANDKIKAQEPESSFVGSVGERIEVDATFWNEFTFTHENFYGMQETSYIYIFKDSNGNQMKWSTSAVVPFGIGTRLHLKGTVKEHSEYKGIKQTILTRCKVMAKEVR